MEGILYFGMRRALRQALHRVDGANFLSLYAAGSVHSRTTACHRSHSQSDAIAGVRLREFSDKRGGDPPAGWYERGVWIDHDEIEARMTDTTGGDMESATSSAAYPKEPQTALAKQIKAIIKFRGGPITVAEYMKEVLTNPVGGFYSASGSDAIGRDGHFITSPEVSFLFGEVMAMWVYNAYLEMGSPKKFALVELGPGRGTLMRQMLLAVKCLPEHQQFMAAAEVHLVEVSPGLRRLQHDKLDCEGAITIQQLQAMSAESQTSLQRAANDVSTSSTVSRLRTTLPAGATIAKPKVPAPADMNASEDIVRVGAGTSRMDVAFARTLHDDTIARAHSQLADATVHWHYNLDEVPGDVPIIVIGQEYLDALPVHQFVRDEHQQWREVLIQAASDPSDTKHLDFILSPPGSIAVRNVLKRRLESLPDRDAINAIEVNPQAMAVAEAVATRISKAGGAALFVDYGQDGPYEQSLNAIKNHKPAHVLSEPGNCDVTAWVDFSALRQAVDSCSANARLHGPIQQGHFLMAMGMEQRLDMLLQKERSEKEREQLEDGFAMLVAGIEHHPQGMGETFKVVAITPSNQPAPWPFDFDFSSVPRNG